jgi:hypothetical protein
MPGLLLSLTASLEVPQSACAPTAVWPPTPTPKAEAYLLHSGMMCRPLLVNAAQCDSEPDQGLVPILFEMQDQRVGVLTGKSPFFGRQCSQSVKVKNTFIDGFLDDGEQNDGLPVAACKSWCAGFTRQGSASWSCGSTSDGESLTAPSSPEGAARPGLSAEPPSPPPSPPSPVRKPQASAGAELHGTGRCRPCGWFWKPEGCVHGAECCHCHMCPEGELKARKKAKIATMRTRKHAESANDSQ